MATPTPEVAKVDYLIDENGSRIEVPDDTGVRAAGAEEAAVGATSPTNWWGMGLIALAALIAVFLLMQIIGGGAPSTDVVPGTPISEPAPETPAVPVV